MKLVKAIGVEQTLKYDSVSTIIVPLEGIVVPDDVANALANRCAVEVSDAPSDPSEIPAVTSDVSSSPAPEVAIEPMPEPSPAIETPTIEELLDANQ